MFGRPVASGQRAEGGRGAEHSSVAAQWQRRTSRARQSSKRADTMGSEPISQRRNPPHSASLDRMGISCGWAYKRDPENEPTAGGGVADSQLSRTPELSGYTPAEGSANKYWHAKQPIGQQSARLHPFEIEGTAAPWLRRPGAVIGVPDFG